MATLEIGLDKMIEFDDRLDIGDYLPFWTKDDNDIMTKEDAEKLIEHLIKVFEIQPKV
jgi:hypothetical protein